MNNFPNNNLNKLDSQIIAALINASATIISAIIVTYLR